MTDSPPNVSPTKVSPRWLVGLTLAAYWIGLVYQLGAQWSAFEQYNYGWAVPFLCLYLIWQRLPELRTPNSELRTPNFLLLLVLCALLYAPTRLLHEANPVWRLTSLLWALEVVGLTLCVVGLAGGQGWLRQLAFPICFFLVAVPWPTGVEIFVIQSLTHANTSATVELAGWLGIPAIQHGNVIELASGMVGIDEACSGIRSVQATTMISFFFGELYRLTVLRRGLCVVAGFALSFLFNLSRTTLLTWVAASRGTKAIAQWHDPAGLTILVACFLSLWGLAWWMGRGKTESRNSESGKRKAESGNFSAALRPLVFALLGWFMLVEAGTELWFRAHENPAGLAAQWTANFPSESANFQSVNLSAEVRGKLLFDEGRSARWQAADGSNWQVFDLVWHPARSIYDRVKVSLTKSHNPEVCLQAAGMKMRSELEPVVFESAPGQAIHFRRYIFEAEGKIIHVYFSVAESMQAGSSPGYLRMTSWERVQAAFAGSRNYGQHTLEIAVWGSDDPQAADASFRLEMAKLIRPQNP